jgi:CRISPR/Cas system-associated endoribonuclease Cas2
MPSSCNPAILTAEERTREVAQILARGLARLHRPQSSFVSAADSATKEVLENSLNRLASEPEQSVTVHGG